MVGYDGSDESWSAVDYAAQLAGRRGLSLKIVHAFVWSTPYASVGPYGAPAALDADEQAHTRIRELLERVRGLYPGLEVDGYAAGRAPAAVLIAESGHATLVVVGHRGTGGRSELHLSSVGAQVTADAGCPVIVVRGEGDPAGPVLLGVNPEEPSRAAVEAGADEALSRKLPLRALYAWNAPDAETFEAGRVDAAARLDAALAGLATSHPGLTLEPVVTHSLDPATDLVDASATAALVVVGRREISGLRRLLMGSVSRTLLHRAHCPVLVARQHLD